MKREQIYLEGKEETIKEVIEIARENLGIGINVVKLMPCMAIDEIVQKLKEIVEGGFCEGDMLSLIDELEDALDMEKKQK